MVHNRSPEKAEELGEEGATVAGSPKEVAEGSDIIITMLPDSPQVREVVAEENGILEGIEEGALLVDMSTISPVVTEELAAEVKKKGWGGEDHSALLRVIEDLSQHTIA